MPSRHDAMRAVDHKKSWLGFVQLAWRDYSPCVCEGLKSWFRSLILTDIAKAQIETYAWNARKGLRFISVFGICEGLKSWNCSLLWRTLLTFIPRTPFSRLRRRKTCCLNSQWKNNFFVVCIYYYANPYIYVCMFLVYARRNSMLLFALRCDMLLWRLQLS